jgi:hypothetical protein
VVTIINSGITKKALYAKSSKITGTCSIAKAIVADE